MYMDPALFFLQSFFLFFFIQNLIICLIFSFFKIYNLVPLPYSYIPFTFTQVPAWQHWISDLGRPLLSRHKKYSVAAKKIWRTAQDFFSRNRGAVSRAIVGEVQVYCTAYCSVSLCRTNIRRRTVRSTLNLNICFFAFIGFITSYSFKIHHAS